jgi:hypothetical protein
MPDFEEFCERHLGSRIRAVLFESRSTNHVLGALLEDGRRVVVKAHRPRQSRELVEAVLRVQAAHAGAGFPCPRPLAGPAPLGEGLGTAEELIDEGESRDTHDPALRRAMAELLARHVEIARACDEPTLARNWDILQGDSLWPPERHDPSFDFEATAAGAEWIDRVAAEARPRAAEPAEPIAGHMDWSGEHFRFTGDRATVVYDWDSLALRPEHHVVGAAAGTFTHNPPSGAPLAPSPEEAAAFVDEYGAARGRPPSTAERERIAAMTTYVIAYIARCEHALGQTPADDRTFSAALNRHTTAYLKH